MPTRTEPKRLADPASRLSYRYDAVVIGSGYGGSIAAARLAASGSSVCVLERGREWLPGDFPTDETSVLRAIRTPLNPLGLIDPNTQGANDMDVVVGCGLGGTSLVNAGISLRPEAAVLEQPEWPKAIRDAHADGSLAEYYARAEEMLGARPWDGLSLLSKVRAHRATVATRGVQHATLPLNVTRKATKRHGVPMQACTSCGDCVAGCNVGAKNTLSTNYLPFAKKHGARIFTCTEVRRIEPSDDGGYVVHFVRHREGTGGSVEGSVRARIVVLGAGSMGSTEILLRSQTDRFRFSRRLGDRFSANADILGFSYNGRFRTDVVGYGNSVVGEREGWLVGCTICSYGDYRLGEVKAFEERFLLLEGAIPTALTKLVARGVGTYALTHAHRMTSEQRERMARDLEPFAAPGPDGALNHSMLFLACGHDSAGGRLVLSDPSGRVTVAWPGAGKERAFSLIEREMEALAKEHGGIFVPNPRSTLLAGERQMTVHPLGGCPMGDDADRGAVDDRGRVFDGEGGVHAGLFVADGAVVPRSLGVTPLLTISALAERIADGIVRGLSRDTAGHVRDGASRP